MITGAPGTCAEEDTAMTAVGERFRSERSDEDLGISQDMHSKRFTGNKHKMNDLTF